MLFGSGWVDRKSSQFISRLVTGTEKRKKTFTEKRVNNKNSTHENRNIYVETNVRISVQWPSRSNRYAGTSVQMFQLLCIACISVLNWTKVLLCADWFFLNASIKTRKTNTHTQHSYKNSPTTHFPLCFQWLKKSSTKTKPTLPTPVHLSQNKGIN